MKLYSHNAARRLAQLIEKENDAMEVRSALIPLAHAVLNFDTSSTNLVTLLATVADSFPVADDRIILSTEPSALSKLSKACLH